MSKKQLIRLNENQLKRIVSESVRMVLKEIHDDFPHAEFDGEENSIDDELTHGDMDLTPVIRAAKHAAQNPRHTYKAYVKGFLFNITFQPDGVFKGYGATMSFSPDWAHTNHCYGPTLEDFIASVKNHIKNAMTIFTNGGKFTEKRHINKF